MSKNKKDNWDKFIDGALSDLKSGDVIRARREALNFTHKDIEEITQIDSGNISKYETGSLAIGKLVAEKFAVALGISVSTILYPNGEDKIKEKEEYAQMILIADRIFKEKLKAVAIR